MSYKVIGIGNPGTSIKFGGDDLDKIAQLLNGVTSGIPAATIKSTNKFGFWDNTCYFRNQADTKSTRIRGQANSPSVDVDLTLPPIIANDKLVALGISQVFSAYQEFDAGVQLKSQSSPSNPGAGIQHFYVDSADNRFKRKKNDGTVTDYDTGLAGIPVGSNKQIQYNNSGAFGAEAGFEYDQSVNEFTTFGATITEDLILSGVISPTQITGNVNNYNPTGLATATTLRLNSNAAWNITGITAQPSGTILIIHNIGNFTITLKDQDSGSSAANRFGFTGDLSLAADQSAILRYDGNSVFWRLIGSDSIPAGANIAFTNVINSFTKGQEIEEDSNTADQLVILQKTNVVGDTAVISSQMKNSLNNYFNSGWLKWQLEVNTSGAEDTAFYVVTRTAGTNITPFKITAVGTLDCGGTNRRVRITESGLTAQRTFTFPNLDTMLAGYANAGTFTAAQTINLNASTLATLFKPVNTAATEWGMNFDARDSANNQTNYAQLQAGISDNTDTSEDGFLKVYLMIAGALQRVATFRETGTFLCGGTNARVEFSESGLTATRTITFQDVQSKQAALSFANIFLEAQTIQKTGITQFFTMYNPAALANNDKVAQYFQGQSSTGVQRDYSRIYMVCTDGTNASEDADFGIELMKAGTLGLALKVKGTGELDIGNNGRLRLRENNLTAQRIMDFPDADSLLEGVVLRSGTTVDINTTITETDLLNYSVPGNALKANGSVHFLITGYLLQNQATGTTYTFIVKFGTTNMISCVSPSVAQSATKIPFRIVGEVFNKNATNAQGASMDIVCNDTTAITTGIGSIANDTILFSGNSDSEGADTAKDTTSAQTLQVTVTMSVSNAATHTVVKHKEVELVSSA